MLDINYIRENTEEVKKKVKSKNFDSKIIDEVLKLDEQRRKLLKEIEDLRAERNIAASEKNIIQGKEIKVKLQELEPELQKAEEKYKEVLWGIPNLPAEDVKVGKDEKENVELRKVGKIPEFDFEPKSHLDLGVALDMLDFESGAKVAGSQFYYLKNDAVLLEYALIQFGLEILQKKGFTLVQTPDMARSRYYLGTGYLPKGEEAQIYEIKDEDLGLIATAEVTMAGMFADSVINHKDLPMKFAAISHCFRREAGAYGKYSKGLYRVHQFTKLEMFAYATPEKSDEIHREFLAIEEEIAQELGIPYRVIDMCSGDLGAIANRKYDLEAWMPGRGDYGEITSTSNVGDYQARNLNIKYKPRLRGVAGKTTEGKNEYVHMVNGTAIVLSRFPIAIIENYQNKDGSVNVPEVLQKWMGKKKIVQTS
jgi:seryl-tRNA synthetase